MTLMVIDDDPDDIMFFRDILSMIDPKIECISFLDGNEAIAFLDQSRLPLVLFLDINMPSINGIEVLKNLRANPRLRDLNIVMLSTYIDEKQIQLFNKERVAYATKGNSVLAWRKVIEGQLDRVLN